LIAFMWQFSSLAALKGISCEEESSIEVLQIMALVFHGFMMDQFETMHKLRLKIGYYYSFGCVAFLGLVFLICSIIAFNQDDECILWDYAQAFMYIMGLGFSIPSLLYLIYLRISGPSEEALNRADISQKEAKRHAGFKVILGIVVIFSVYLSVIAMPCKLTEEKCEIVEFDCNADGSTYLAESCSIIDDYPNQVSINSIIVLLALAVVFDLLTTMESIGNSFGKWSNVFFIVGLSFSMIQTGALSKMTITTHVKDVMIYTGGIIGFLWTLLQIITAENEMLLLVGLIIYTFTLEMQVDWDEIDSIISKKVARLLYLVNVFFMLTVGVSTIGQNFVFITCDRFTVIKIRMWIYGLGFLWDHCSY